MAAPSRAAQESSGSTQGSQVPEHSNPSHPVSARGRAIHHGQTPAAWVGSITAIIAVVIGGFGVVFQNWVVFGIGLALLVLAGIAGKVLQKMGYGAY